MNKPLIFLDFDETLFNHLAFVEWLDDYLQSEHAIEKGDFANTLWEYHDRIDDIHRLYRHADHIESLTNRSWAFISAEVERLCHSQAADFCYPEVHETLDWLISNDYKPRILSFGDGEYQRFKINLCPMLRAHNLPMHIVSKPKRDFLSSEFSDIHEGYLVDDKYPLDVKPPWTHVWLKRGKNISIQQTSNIHEISNLYELKDLLKKV